MLLIFSILLKHFSFVILLALVFSAADYFIYKTIFWSVLDRSCIIKISDRIVEEFKEFVSEKKIHT